MPNVMRVGGPTPQPGHFTPGKDTRYPLYRRLTLFPSCKLAVAWSWPSTLI